MTSTNKLTALAIGGMMTFSLLIASSVLAQTTPAQTTQVQTAKTQKQRTQGGPDCDFSMPKSRLSPDCQNIKEGLDQVK